MGGATWECSDMDKRSQAANGASQIVCGPSDGIRVGVLEVLTA